MVNKQLDVFLFDLKQVLVWQVVPGVDLKDKNVVDSSLSPSISVDAQQEEELDQEETATVDPHQRPHSVIAEECNTCNKQQQWFQ